MIGLMAHREMVTPLPSQVTSEINGRGGSKAQCFICLAPQCDLPSIQDWQSEASEFYCTDSKFLQSPQNWKQKLKQSMAMHPVLLILLLNTRSG